MPGGQGRCPGSGPSAWPGSRWVLLPLRRIPSRIGTCSKSSRVTKRSPSRTTYCRVGSGSPAARTRRRNLVSSRLSVAAAFGSRLARNSRMVAIPLRPCAPSSSSRTTNSPYRLPLFMKADSAAVSKVSGSTTPARSTGVRAMLTRNPLYSAQSRRASTVVRCRTMPPGTRRVPRVVMSSMVPGCNPSIPQTSPADRWETAVPSPAQTSAAFKRCSQPGGTALRT